MQDFQSVLKNHLTLGDFWISGALSSHRVPIVAEVQTLCLRSSSVCFQFSLCGQELIKNTL